jgi:hypothetical protein
MKNALQKQAEVETVVSEIKEPETHYRFKGTRGQRGIEVGNAA